MLPALQPGAIISISSQPFSSVRCGQVVAFTCGQRLIVHRVIDRTVEHLVTLGDNMRLLDPPVTPETYIGLVDGIPQAVPPFQGGVQMPTTSLDPQVPLSTVKIVLPSCLAAVVPPGITLGILPSGSAFPDSDSFCIGISSAGALTSQALPELLGMGMRCYPEVLIFLGFTFGFPNPTKTEPTLPPEIAAFHVRLGRPWQDLDVDAALGELGVQIDLLRRRTTIFVKH